MSLAAEFNRSDEIGTANSAAIPRKKSAARIAGWSLSILVALFMLADGVGHTMQFAPYVKEGESMNTPLSPYLTFNGNCAAAMNFYQKTLGGKLDLMKMKDAPPSPHVPASDGDRVMHARLVFDGGTIMASDTLSSQKYEPMKSMSLAITYPTAADAKKVFDEYADGGEVTMPLNSSFFADAFGMVVDRFGTPWIITGGMKPGM